MILFEANAGTGKTFKINTLILEGLLKKNYQPHQILATTFTVKGASEIRNRLIGALKKILKGEEVDELKEINIDVKQVKESKIIDIFNNIDKLFVGTIHSWCLRFLRIFPNKVNLPPSINVDEDKNMLNYYFEREWRIWLYEFIRENINLVSCFKLDNIKELAKDLVFYQYETLENGSSLDETKVFECVLQRLKNMVPRLTGIERSPYQLTDEEKLMYRYLHEYSDKNKWISNEGKHLLFDYIHYDNKLINNLLEKISSLVNTVRDKMLNAGYVNFETLLQYAKDVLKKNVDVRNFVKDLYKLVLVDEAQDTSPIQYEIIFYMCEKIGEFGSDWRKLNIEPEKLIIVGDPKQSIYSFRGADLKAYKEVVRKSVVVKYLTKNTRSCKNILDFTNDVAKTLFEDEGIKCSPSEYSKKEIKKIDRCEGKSIQDCVKIVNLQFGEIKKYEKIYKEAMWIANNIKNKHKEGRNFRSFAVLLRKIQRPFIYIDVFSKNKIPFVIESEKYFYQTQEVIDFINLINFIIDPEDKNALAGFMRSPLMACSDYDLVQFFRNSDQNKIDALRGTGLRKYVFDKIEELRSLVDLVSFSELIYRVLQEIPVLELLQICYRKEIVPFNVLKLWQEVSEYELSHPQVCKMEFKKLLIKNCRSLFDMGQEPLFDEKTDVVKILSIHKSKGLEFPVVYLPCIDVESPSEKYEVNDIIYDWVNNDVGIKCSGITNKNYLNLKYVENIDTERGCEEKRVFYVGVTRAMEELIITYSGEKEKSEHDDRCSNISDVIQVIRGRLEDKYRFEDVRFSDDISNDSMKDVETLCIGVNEVDFIFQRWQKIKSISSTIEKKIISVSELLDEMSLPASMYNAGNKGKFSTLLVGTICHYVLSKVDFNNVQGWISIFDRAIKEHKISVEQSILKEVEDECRQILTKFFDGSSAYLWLSGVEILGREVPVLYKVNNNQIVSGMIDLLAKLGNKYYIVDYKTTNELTQEQIMKYGEQLQYYREALDKKHYSSGVRTIVLLRSNRILFLDS